MKAHHIVPVLFAVLTPGLSHAEWEKIGSNGNEFAIFVDADLAKRNGSVVNLPQLVTYGEPQSPGASGKQFRSEKSLVDYDCASKRSRVVASERFAGERATGNAIYRESNPQAAWTPIPMQTNMEVAWRLACGTR